jgi:rod shape determining protein RodA
MARQDRVLFGLTLALAAIGLMALYAALHGDRADSLVHPDFLRQSFWMAGGLMVMFLVGRIPFSTISGAAFMLYAGGILLLLATLAVAPTIRGARSWIPLGPIRLQASELIKPILALALARFVAGRRIASKPLLGTAGAVAIGLLPFGLVLLQPDFGTALTYGSLILAIPYVAGLPTRFITYGLAASFFFGGRILLGVAQGELAMIPTEAGLFVTEPAAGIVVFGAACLILILAHLAERGTKRATGGSRPLFSRAWLIGLVLSLAAYLASFAAEELLKPYQRRRILAFVAPGVDPQGASYNVLQSMIAVGSGGLFGRGPEKATQTTLGFLPERQTDFIFSVIGEAFGLFGALLVIALFTLLVVRIATIGLRSASGTGALYTSGIGALFALHLFVNAGMTMGLVPVIGIPLPLLSYGGSSMLSTFLALGIVQSIAVERRRAMLGSNVLP